MGCLYIKSLDDVHMPTLKTLVRRSVKKLKEIEKEKFGIIGDRRRETGKERNG